MSITIPASSLPPQAAAPAQDAAEPPSKENLMMAAAEMHRMNRFPFMSDFYSGVQQLVDVSKNYKTNPQALESMPLSKNIEDRRNEKYYGRGRKGMLEREKQDMTNEFLK